MTIESRRQTGRTTRLLTEAVERASKGEGVAFVVHNGAMAEHVHHMLHRLFDTFMADVREVGVRRWRHPSGGTFTIATASAYSVERDGTPILDRVARGEL